jgi:hypothetical protein
METQYLIQQAQDALLLTDEERIAFMLNEKWFLYPVAKEILKELEFHLKHPKKNRMKGRLIVGGTNNGKTSIVNKFIRSHMPYDDENVKITPVVAVSAPESSNPSDLYGSILHKLGVPYKNTDRATKKKEKVEGIFLLCGTNMLIIDEIHNIIVAPVQKQKAFMVALKNLSNELMIPIILVGTADALHAINTDSQISNRFPPLVVPKWKYDRAFLSLLASIEKTLPLRKQSNMATSKEISNYILDYSEGYIGEIIDLINLAAQYAIEQKIESITMETLKKSNFVRPSMRKNIADFIEI